MLDPEGWYWCYPGDDTDDPGKARVVEVRLDVPIAGVPVAQADMQHDGWNLHSQPDDASDPMQRLYFRKAVSLGPDEKVAMLTTSLRAAARADGTFWSWLNVDDLDRDEN